VPPPAAAIFSLPSAPGRFLSAPGSDRQLAPVPTAQKAPTWKAHRGGVCSVVDAMPWLADTDVEAALGLARSLVEARTKAELRGRALWALAELVPADVLTWDRVALATGAVRHEAIPADAEPPGAFAAIVGDAAGHPLLAAHAAQRRSALRLSEAVEPHRLSHSKLYGDLLHRSGVEYGIAIGMRTGRGEAVVAGFGRTEREFSERDRDVLDIVRAGLEAALRAAEARGRLVRALAAGPPPGTAVVLLDRYGEIELSSLDAERWLAEHFGAAEHPGWLPGPVAWWLALPPRPPLVSERDGRRLTVRLVPGDPHALLLEEEVASFRMDALERLGLTPRETEVLRAAAAIEDEAEIACELFLSLHAVRERLERLEAKLGVRTAADAVARVLRESA
jgi:DNA-binding CsgD family transcriptional regulator